MKQIGSVLLLIILFTIGCNISKNSADSDMIDSKSILTVGYYQVPGNNAMDPEYTIELFSNRQMILEAKKNLDKSGKYMRTLSQPEYDQLIQAFVDAKFFKYKSEYTNDTLANLPTRFVYFAYQGKEKKVKDYYHAPETLTQLEYSIQSFLDRVGWEKMTW